MDKARLPGKMPQGLKAASVKRPKASLFSMESFFKIFLCGVVFFYAGICVGWNMDRSCDCERNSNNNNPANLRVPKPTEGLESDEIKSIKKLLHEYKEKEDNWAIQLNDMTHKLKEEEEIVKRMKVCKELNNDKSDGDVNKLKDRIHRMENKESELRQKLSEQHFELIRDKKDDTTPHHTNFFRAKHTGQFMHGMETVDRTEFANHFDTGGPLDPSGWGNNQVVILYSDKKALPPPNSTIDIRGHGDPGISVEDATKNCRNLHVILTADGRTQQCIAVVAQYESYHIQKFMRMGDKTKGQKQELSDRYPLRYVNRNMKITGEINVSPPLQKQSRAFWKLLVPYLSSLQSVLDELKPIAEIAASNTPTETIIVMVCNLGHSEMLMNFICNAHAKGLQDTLKSVLIFATDPEMHKLALSLGMNSFYSETVFSEVPQESAGQYGDYVYSKIMLSKVYCVHLVSQLGYDLLFQDVDIVWYKNPIPFFYNDLPERNNFKALNWDMIFQDDGARTLFFAPYSANTGFYFVRNNIRTQNFFNQLLVNGDLILSTSSHQNALIVLLTEHASLHGLRTKTWDRLQSEFPGGHAYHQRPNFMKKLINSKNSTDLRGLLKTGGETDPYLFHMSWTINKDNKLKYFQQMGEWFLNEKCNANSDKKEQEALDNATIENCCTAKPLIKCYYKDKASIIPCKDSPSLDDGKGLSFW